LKFQRRQAETRSGLMLRSIDTDACGNRASGKGRGGVWCSANGLAGFFPAIESAADFIPESVADLLPNQRGGARRLSVLSGHEWRKHSKFVRYVFPWLQYFQPMVQGQL
jgi:hypothetical protein